MDQKFDIDRLRRARSDPEVSRLMERLSPEDRKKLEETLSSPERIKSLLAAPQARELLERLKRGGK